MSDLPRRPGDPWMRALLRAWCQHCSGWIEKGDWQGLADMAGVGRRWVHQRCAVALGASEPDPHADRDRPPGQPSTALRLLVVGSVAWPRGRAVEVRDALAAVAWGHRPVCVVHTARTDPETGSLAGVDAWAELTATRLGFTTEHITIGGAAPHDRPTDQGRHHALIARGGDVVVAFPLEGPDRARDESTLDAIDRAGAAGLPVLTHVAPARRPAGS